jgi:hypothetical protein
VPRTCTVCAHEDAVLINEALVLHKNSNRSIAKQYGVDHNAVQRHREHIPRLLVRVRAFIDKAEAADDGPEFRAHAGEWRKQVELLAKIAGELQQEGTTKNYVFISPVVTQTIVAALAPYPEAGYAVSDALKELGAGSAIQ